VELRLLRVGQLRGGATGPDHLVPLGRSLDGKVITTKDGKRDSALFAFQSVPVRSTCVQHAELTLFAPHGSSAGPVRVYPSAALSFALGKVIADSSGGAGTLLDNQPAADPADTAPGNQTFDITDIVRLWVDGGPFSSGDRWIATSSPLVLNLRVPDSTSGAYEVAFKASKPAPRLVITTQLGRK
jgi:hypothetical protein